MSLTYNFKSINLKDAEKNVKSTIIKEESSKQVTQKCKVHLEDNNNSPSINAPLSSPSIEDLNSYVTQMNFNLSQVQYLNVFKNQNSTRQLQKQLLGISKKTIDKIINELSGVFSKVIKDKNGNYFCSNLIKICSQEQRIKILKELSSTIDEDCNDEFGTHPIQNLIKLASSEEEFKLILSSFNDFTKIVLASMNQYGTYVIQKIFEHIPESIRTDFNLIFINSSCFLSRHTYGVSVVKKFIANTRNEYIVYKFLYLIMTNFVNISDNKYGNYLIQYLLEKWWNKREGQILKYCIVSKFNDLNKKKYSVYVCDLYLKLCSEKEKELLIASSNYNSNKNIDDILPINEYLKKKMIFKSKKTK